MKNILGSYKNGNYNVTILKDGTKIRETEEDEFVPSSPESMDIKITNFCNLNCPFCHEMSHENGKHGNILNKKLIESIKPYTECAIGGGNPLSHPDLVPFLKMLKDSKAIPNMTINQKHFDDSTIRFVKKLQKESLLYGVGISLDKPNKQLFKVIEEIDNLVIHTICGITPYEYYQALFDNPRVKILILGYKEIGRGKIYKPDSTHYSNLYDRLHKIISRIPITSFDNLAIEQLPIKNLIEKMIPDKMWDEFYMGDEGNFTYYIDLVKQEYAQSSTSDKRYNLLDDVNVMFQNIRKESL